MEGDCMVKKEDSVVRRSSKNKNKKDSTEKGYLALVLHCHLPYVRHPEHDRFLEEDWLYEAITETYIPLINVFEALINDGVDFRLTMSLTPTLISMLTDALLQPALSPAYQSADRTCREGNRAHEERTGIQFLGTHVLRPVS